MNTTLLSQGLLSTIVEKAGFRWLPPFTTFCYWLLSVVSKIAVVQYIN